MHTTTPVHCDNQILSIQRTIMPSDVSATDPMTCFTVADVGGARGNVTNGIPFSLVQTYGSGF